jgi:hypothetical protein
MDRINAEWTVWISVIINIILNVIKNISLCYVIITIERELLSIYCIPPNVSMCVRVCLVVSERFGGSVVLARSISHHAEFVKPPAPKNP